MIYEESNDYFERVFFGANRSSVTLLGIQFVFFQICRQMMVFDNSFFFWNQTQFHLVPKLEENYPHNLISFDL